jgi:hypothetical protein
VLLSRIRVASMMSDLRRTAVVLRTLLGVLALGACSTQSDLPAEASATPFREVAPTNTPNYGSGAEVSSQAPPWEALPLQGYANVRGTIELESPTVLLGELFLASAMPTSQPGVDVLELDTGTAPRAVIDRDTGRFVFSDVQPGRYGVIAWEPMSSAALVEPSTGETLFLDIVADKIVDVGTLYYP